LRLAISEPTTVSLTTSGTAERLMVQASASSVLESLEDLLLHREHGLGRNANLLTALHANRGALCGCAAVRSEASEACRPGRAWGSVGRLRMSARPLTTASCTSGA
jgi:hypothetical protein